VLVAETDDEAAGYYVPPVDVTTIAAHLAIFHAAADEPRRGSAHARRRRHARAPRRRARAAGNGAALAVNHWHTKTRPGVSD
jgi:hypothetical protein